MVAAARCSAVKVAVAALHQRGCWYSTIDLTEWHRPDESAALGHLEHGSHHPRNAWICGVTAGRSGPVHVPVLTFHQLGLRVGAICTIEGKRPDERAVGVHFENRSQIVCAAA